MYMRLQADDVLRRRAPKLDEENKVALHQSKCSLVGKVVANDGTAVVDQERQPCIM
jgi:hypothetical protein